MDESANKPEKPMVPGEGARVPSFAQGPDFTGKFLDNGKYEILRFIDGGGIGDLYEGRQTAVPAGDPGTSLSDEKVAIKIFLRLAARNRNFERWFRQDSEVLKRLEHPNLVKYRAFAFEPSLRIFYVVTDFVDGPNLLDALPSTRADAVALLNLTRVLAEALRIAHKEGVFHSDLCAENVLLPQGDLEKAKIANFGVARKTPASGETMSAGNLVPYRFGYSAPEQLSDAEIGPWTDVYSLALIILAVATGKPVSMGTNLAEAVAHRKSVPDLSVLPDELRPLFSKMLAPKPAERLRTMDEVCSEIDRISIPPPVVEVKSPEPLSVDTLTRHPNYVGVTLNGIYDVQEFIARGGMGEVYRGTAIDSGETVAIKIVLPELAADPNIQRTFRQEARVLMQLHHPGVVQYRLFARDKNLDVHYIVTEFVDGTTLSNALPSLDTSFEQIRDLTRRLAEALSSAHRLGIIHRDLCPDNVLLPNGSLAHAKLIDFGIAKKTAAVNETFFTTQGGFVGRFGYSAPEQFSDKPIGPWTDVYSLALVVLAVAGRAHSPMGTNFWQAVECRTTVPDLSALPPEFHSLFEGMLAPDPAHRIRSMDEVCAALADLRPTVATATTIASTPESNVQRQWETPAADPVAQRPSRRGWPIVAGGAGALAAVAAALFLWPRTPAPPRVPPTLVATVPANDAVNVATGADIQLTFNETVKAGGGNIVIHKSSDGSTVASIAANDATQVRINESVVVVNPSADLAEGTDYYVIVPPGAITDEAGDNFSGLADNAGLHFKTALPRPEVVRQRLENALAGMTCRWLNLDYQDLPDSDPAGERRVALSGLAGGSLDVEARINTLKQAAGAGVPLNVDAGAVWPVQAEACGALDAFARFREQSPSTARSLVVSQAQYILGRPANCRQAGRQAEVTVTLAVDPAKDFSLIGLLPNGRVQQILPDRATFDRIRQRPGFAEDLGNNTYRVSLCTDQATARESPNGRFGLVLLRGNGPFSLGLRADDFAVVPADWSQRFATAATDKGWTTEMVWYEVLDGAAPAPRR